MHRELGPGSLESAYQMCLCEELKLRGISFLPKVGLPVVYKGVRLDCGYEIDILVDDTVIVEVKAVTRLHPVY